MTHGSTRCLARVLTAVALLITARTALAQDRMPPIPAERYTPEQREKVAEHMKIREGVGGGPYIVLLRSPEAYIRTAHLSDYLRFKSPIGPKLTEFVSLIAAWHTRARFQWGARYTGSLREGVAKEVLDALADGRRPESMAEDEAIAYDFCTELHVMKAVSDGTYARAVTKFGEQGVVDITAISGYYVYIGLLTNMARTPAGNSTVPLPATFPRWADAR